MVDQRIRGMSGLYQGNVMYYNVYESIWNSSLKSCMQISSARRDRGTADREGVGRDLWHCSMEACVSWQKLWLDITHIITTSTYQFAN